MRYYKAISNGYITAIGTGGGGMEITEQEYNQTMSVIQSKPMRTDTMDYHLRVDLTWEEYERPVEPETDELLDPEETLDILMGEIEE